MTAGERATPADEESSDGATGTGTAPAVTCTVAMCPICTLVTAFGEARPELTEHLLVAGRELMLALKALIEARLGEEPPPRKGGLTRINVV